MTDAFINYNTNPVTEDNVSMINDEYLSTTDKTMLENALLDELDIQDR